MKTNKAVQSLYEKARDLIAKESKISTVVRSIERDLCKAAAENPNNTTLLTLHAQQLSEATKSFNEVKARREEYQRQARELDKASA